MISFIKNKYNSLVSDDKFTEILSGSIVALTSRSAATGLALISNILIARYYGAESMGILAMVSSFLTLVTIFTMLGTDVSLLRLIPEHTVKYSVSSAFHVYRKTQYFVSALSIAAGILLFACSAWVAGTLFAKPHLSPVFALASIFILFNSLVLLNTQAVRSVKLIKTFAAMQALPSLSMLLILLSAVVLSRNKYIPLYAQLAAWCLTGVAGVIIMDRVFKRSQRSDDRIQFVPMREVVALSFPLLLAASMQYFIGQTGVLILGMFRSEGEVGHYAIAVKLATLTTFILQAINTIAAPKFTELYYSGKMDELFHVAIKSTKLIFWTTVPILLILLGLGKQLLGFVFGSDFTVAYTAMVILIISQFVNSISGSVGIFLIMAGHQKFFSKILFVAAVINISLCFLLVPGYGINGSAFAVAVSVVFWNMYSLYFIKKGYGRTIGYLPFIR